MSTISGTAVKRTRAEWEKSEEENLSSLLSAEQVIQLIDDVYSDKESLLVFLGNEKLSEGKKKSATVSVKKSVNSISEALSKLSSAYLAKLATAKVSNMCENYMTRACKNIEQAAEALALNAATSTHTPALSYANIAARAGTQVKETNSCSALIHNRVKSCMNNPIKRVVVGPCESAKEKFTSSKTTKETLMNSVDPTKLKFNVSRVIDGYNNSVILEGDSLDAATLMKCPALAASDLEVKTEQKSKPRIIVHGIPVDLPKEDIIKCIVDQNCSDFAHEDLQVIYLYPAREKKFRSCVLEVSANVRLFLLKRSRVNIGWCSCRVEDHVSVLQCFKCLQFGHIAQACTAAVCCANCAGTHSTKECSNKANLRCGNCARANMNSLDHSAYDKVKCPILCRKIERKITFIDYGC